MSSARWRWRRSAASSPTARRRAAALGLHALVDGLLQNWMLDPAGFQLVDVGGQVIEAFLAGLAVPRAAGHGSGAAQ